jgi:hypothetical protein
MNTQTISPQQFGKMCVIANDIGTHFANYPDREPMLRWADAARDELIEVLDFPNPHFRDQLDIIDRVLDAVEQKRAAVIAGHERINEQIRQAGNYYVRMTSYSPSYVRQDLTANFLKYFGRGISYANRRSIIDTIVEHVRSWRNED